MNRQILSVLIASCLMMFFTDWARAVVPREDNEELVPTGKGYGERAAPGHVAPSAHPGTTSNGIGYHGGPVLVNGVNAYYIWYGNWSGNTAPSMLTDFANTIGGSPYFNINTSYYDGSGAHVQNVAHYSGVVLNNYSLGTALSDSNVWSVVADAINSGSLPADSNGVYFVLTSADVNETSGFCTKYCGWHAHSSISTALGLTDIKYSFVGNPDRCPSACEAQSVGPNGNAGADGMASIIAHELEEAVTDPDLNAWYDRRGEENADKCAWTFGNTYLTSNGAHANMKLGTRDFLIQRNWVNAGGGYCALSY